MSQQEQSPGDVVAAVRIMIDHEGKYRAEIHVKDFDYVIVLDKCSSIEAACKEAAQRIATSIKPRPL